jgi:hypothetical protein
MPGSLPAVVRFESDGARSRLSFSCLCGESVNAFVTVDASGAEARCPICGTFVQVRASKEYLADGGKPGSGRGAF